MVQSLNAASFIRLSSRAVHNTLSESSWFLETREATRETTREVVTGAYRDAIGEWETTLMSRGGEWCFRLTQ